MGKLIQLSDYRKIPTFKDIVNSDWFLKKCVPMTIERKIKVDVDKGDCITDAVFDEDWSSKTLKPMDDISVICNEDDFELDR